MWLVLYFCTFLVSGAKAIGRAKIGYLFYYFSTTLPCLELDLIL